MKVRLAAALCVIAVAVPTSTTAAAYIAVMPLRSSIDAPISVRVKSRPGEIVRVQMTTKRYGLSFASALSVTATNSDLFDVPDASRLPWTAMPTNAPAEKVTFRRDIDLAPREYQFQATSGKATITETVERLALLPNLRRTVIDNGTLVGTLFAAADGGCRSGVIVLSGSEGGVPEERAAVLAGHGFATLALAYFAMPGLPRELDSVPVELVQHGIDFMKENAAVCHDRPIGILGGSKGAELALVSATLFQDIGAVAAVSPASVVFSGIGSAFGVRSSWSYRGKPLPFANGREPQSVTDAIAAQERAKSKVSYLDEYSSMLAGNTDSGAVIPVDKIQGPILLIAGGEDRLWPSLPMAQQIVRTLRQAHFTFAVDLLSYPAAGHSIGIPYQFAAAELAHSSLALGGTPEANEAASEDSWPKIVDFFTRTLSGKN